MELRNIYLLPNISEKIIMLQNDKRHIRKLCYNQKNRTIQGYYKRNSQFQRYVLSKPLA
jgi:hypothetical protein